jgi:DNA-binding CsgD family transcriptional regulator
VTQLSAKDLRATLDFVGDAHSFDDLDAFRSGILPGLERFVPAVLVQSEVLRLLAAGRGTDEIADALFISPQTVRKHLEHIYERLGVHSREAAVAAARRTSKGDLR